MAAWKHHQIRSCFEDYWQRLACSVHGCEHRGEVGLADFATARDVSHLELNEERGRV